MSGPCRLRIHSAVGKNFALRFGLNLPEIRLARLVVAMFREIIFVPRNCVHFCPFMSIYG